MTYDNGKTANQSEGSAEVMAGQYTECRVVGAEETEVIAAEISIQASNEKLNADTISSEAKNYIDERLQLVNTELDKYTNHADKADYAIAIAGGIISGVIDSVLFNDPNIFKEDIGKSHEKVNRFIQQFAKDRKLVDPGVRNGLTRAVTKLEKAFPVAQDKAFEGLDKISLNDHHLADIAHHPTPLGLLAAIAVKFLRVGVFVNKEGEWSIQLIKIKDYERKDLPFIIASAVISGLMNWLVNIAETKYEEEEGKELPKAIMSLAHLIASTPMIIEVLKCADNWFGHLVSDMGGSSKTAGKSGGMGIPGVFLSLLYEVAALPGLRHTGLLEILDDLYVNHKFDIRHELTFAKQVKAQAISVAFNELFVRTVYMLRHLAQEVTKHQGFEGINWRQIIPFANRTVDRMLFVSSLTFTVADFTDAAARAAFESGGNWVVFSGKFVARYNYVGAGRAAIAIVKEISNEKKEEQLLHERRILMEDKAMIMFQQLQEFKAKLDERMTAYFTEDIEAFLAGFDDINEGLNTNDSDLVIRGNVKIQRVLGREVQFTSQKEFDELMDSDIPLQL